MNLANDKVRKLILNALIWMAKGTVPPNGVESHTSQDDLLQNFDVK